MVWETASFKCVVEVSNMSLENGDISVSVYMVSCPEFLGWLEQMVAVQ